MNCHEFERELDALLEGPLGPKAREALEHHAGECASCSDLLALARLPGVPWLPWLQNQESDDFTRGVLTRTSGSACRQAETSLPDFVAEGLSHGNQELLAEHLEHCQACSGLARELERLSVDLPRLSIVQPEISLLEDVLRRTLPVPVRMRRWWIATWPQWVRRPRFASELAFADGKIEVTREVDGGLQTVALDLPAVVTTDLRLNEPRYASLPNIMRAKKKPIEETTPADLGVDPAPRLILMKVVEPPKRQAGVIVDSVAELVDKLKNEAKVI